MGMAGWIRRVDYRKSASRDVTCSVVVDSTECITTHTSYYTRYEHYTKYDVKVVFREEWFAYTKVL